MFAWVCSCLCLMRLTPLWRVSGLILTCRLSEPEVSWYLFGSSSFLAGRARRSLLLTPVDFQRYLRAAMAPIKRPAATAAAGRGKSAKQDPAAVELNAIRAELSEAEAYPQRVREMLAAGLDASLCARRDVRHSFQEQVAVWKGSGVRSRMQRGSQSVVFDRAASKGGCQDAGVRLASFDSPLASWVANHWPPERPSSR